MSSGIELMKMEANCANMIANNVQYPGLNKRLCSGLQISSELPKNNSLISLQNCLVGHFTLNFYKSRSDN